MSKYKPKSRSRQQDQLDLNFIDYFLICFFVCLLFCSEITQVQISSFKINYCIEKFLRGLIHILKYSLHQQSFSEAP